MGNVIRLSLLILRTTFEAHCCVPSAETENITATESVRITSFLSDDYTHVLFSGTHGDRGILTFPVQLTTNRIGNLTRLIHTLLYVMTIHTYIYIHAI